MIIVIVFRAAFTLKDGIFIKDYIVTCMHSLPTWTINGCCLVYMDPYIQKGGFDHQS